MQFAIATKRNSRPALYVVSPRATTPRCEQTSGGNGGLARALARDEEVFAEGGDTDLFYKVVSGLVRTYKLLNDGRRHIDAFHFAGDIVGLETGGVHRNSAEAVCDASVTSHRRSTLRAGSGVAIDRDFSDQMLLAMTRRLECAGNHMLVLGCKNAQEKMASFLLAMADRLATGNRIDLPMMRSDIADHLGLPIETVSRAMAELARQGVIRISAGHRTITLLDLGALKRLSG